MCCYVSCYVEKSGAVSKGKLQSTKNEKDVPGRYLWRHAKNITHSPCGVLAATDHTGREKSVNESQRVLDT